MSIGDQRLEENYQEYLRLCANPDYGEVILDELSGGVSAIHRFHKFDKQVGPFGIRRGDYERMALEVLRRYGHRIVLESEMGSPGIKMCDGLLDDTPMEIKAIEGTGTWTISTKLLEAEKQHAQCVVLFFPKEELYSGIRIMEGLRLYSSNPVNHNNPGLTNLVALAGQRLVAYGDKKATPVEGWSILEGLRGQNGETPFTIPPSDAKV